MKLNEDDDETDEKDKKPKPNNTAGAKGANRHDSRMSNSRYLSTNSDIIRNRGELSCKEKLLKLYRTKWFSVFMI